jgi:3-hydroxymyristoyl/3-hydroxydecanoyl-(acyl carrier protein) dehydratase
VTMSPFIGDPFLPYLLGINIAQVLGILVLFRTTLR